MSKLIMVACGAGINTSTIAEELNRDRLRKEGIENVDVQRVIIQDIDKFLDRMILVVSMMKIYRTFDVPQVKGMPFLIGTRAEKEALLDEIIRIVRASQN